MSNPKFTAEAIHKAMKNAKASIEVEGYTISKEYEELVRKKLTGEITEEEFLNRAKQLSVK